MQAYTQSKDRLARLFREYWNDFLSLDGFASYHGISTERGSRLINAGRKAHNLNANRSK